MEALDVRQIRHPQVHHRHRDRHRHRHPQARPATSIRSYIRMLVPGCVLMIGSHRYRRRLQPQPLAHGCPRGLISLDSCAHF